jgi:uncharacterized protein with NRDE domain
MAETMCTLLFAWQVDPALPLIVAANRDEFYARPTAAATRWRARTADGTAPEVVAGRDLEAGGTWLGVTREGRFAALTNVREPSVPTPPGLASRGELVAEFLRGRAAPAAYLAGLRPRDLRRLQPGRRRPECLWYLSNRSGPARALGPGVYGVSNAALDTPWPKVRRGREELARLVAVGEATPAALLALLADRRARAGRRAAGHGRRPGDGARAVAAVHRQPGLRHLLVDGGGGPPGGAVELCERSHGPVQPGDVSITMSRER